MHTNSNRIFVQKFINNEDDVTVFLTDLLCFMWHVMASPEVLLVATICVQKTLSSIFWKVSVIKYDLLCTTHWFIVYNWGCHFKQNRISSFKISSLELHYYQCYEQKPGFCLETFYIFNLMRWFNKRTVLRKHCLSYYVSSQLFFYLHGFFL